MVTPNTAVTMSTAEAEAAAWGLLGGRSIPTLKFTYENPPGSGNHVDLGVGTKYAGTVLENPRARHAQDYTTKQPKFYPNGDPIMELDIVLDCQYLIQPGDEDDDGKRVLRGTQHIRRALQDEMQAKNIRSFGPGTYLEIEHVGYNPAKGARPSKKYQVTLSNVQPFRPAEQVAVEQAMGVAPAAPAAPPAPPVAPAVPAIPAAPVAAVAPPAPPATPAAPVAGIGNVVVTEAHVNQAKLLLSNGIDPASAIQAVSNAAQGNEEFRTSLAALIGQPF